MVIQLAGCAGSGSSSPLDEAIAFHESKLREDPGLYGVRAELGEALLERARVTHDPDDVQRARSQLKQSLQLQANFQALKAMAALCNFSHRFEEARSWALQAQDALPEDTGTVAQQVESLLGLGLIDEAQAAVAQRTTREPDFYLTAAEARIMSARGDHDGAVACFVRAADIAQRFGAPSLVVWSNVSAAAEYIDHDRAADAKPFLDAAALIDPHSPLLRVHLAEYESQRGHLREAAEIYSSLLREFDDPVVHAAAYHVQRALGDAARAQDHFRRAEFTFRKAEASGEVYTLEALARLYRDARVRLPEAQDLARRNLEHKRDEHARSLLADIDRLLAESATH